MHNIFIKVHQDSAKQQTKLLFIATNNTIFVVLETWPPEWRAPDLTELEKVIAQKKKDDSKL